MPRLISINLHTQEIRGALDRRVTSHGLDLLKAGVEHLTQMGAEAIVPCTSSLHVVTEGLTMNAPRIAMPDAIGAALQTLKIRRIGLIGAGCEREETYWRKHLANKQVLDVFVPVHRDREHLAHLTIEELQLGIVNQTTRADVGRIVYSLRQAGARAVVLVTPELGLALSHLDPVLPIFDATELHALAALEWSLDIQPPKQAVPAHKLTREKSPRNHATTQA